MENTDPSPSDEYVSPFRTIADHFEKRDLKTLSVDWERKNLFFHMFERQVVMGCGFYVSEDDDMLQIILRYPILVHEEKLRPSVAELLTRANYGLRVGNFELDMKDGEVRYHITHLMENYTISEKLLKRLFNTGMGTTDRYFPALMQHIYSGVTPEDAIYMAELDFHADRVEDSKPAEKRVPKKKPGKPETQGTHLSDTETPPQLGGSQHDQPLLGDSPLHQEDQSGNDEVGGESRDVT